MESTIVIKVKYGETLRRFSARVNEAGLLDLDMYGLREMVLALFNLAPGNDVMLTYIDEDGDVVTLVDDEDLRDVMRQCLNPVRITLKLNAQKSGRSYTRSSGSSTPMRSPIVQPTVPGFETAVSKILGSVPEPLREAVLKEPAREAFLKLWHDLFLKVSSSVPVLSELDSILKLGQSTLNRPSEIQADTESGTQNATAMVASLNKDPKASKDDGTASELMPTANEQPTHKTNQKVDVEGRGAESSSIFAPSSLNLNAGHPGDFGCSYYNSVPPNFPAGLTEEVEKSDEPQKSVDAGAGAGASASTYDMKLGGFGFPMFAHLNPINECPFTGMPVESDSAVPSMHVGSHVSPFKRSYNRNEGLGGVFHRGVRCDGCGVYPITGPRFKSRVKEDYDLCSICFAEMGNVADYIRMDRPVRHPYSYKGFYDPHHRVRSPTVPHVLRGGAMKLSRPKLDSRFILDVNIVDGTIMAPSTPFTKIWRMRNNGSIVWPQGTQLVWIGGDKLTDALSVELQISSYGLTVDNELDVAVEFIAPELPGRYISYWRLSSPYGQKFGQRVWVLIQVDASLKDPLCDSFNGLNLNLPPVNSGSIGPEMVNVKAEPVFVEDSPHEPNNSGLVEDLAWTAVNARPIDQDLNFPINDTLLVGGFLDPVSLEAPTSVSYPVVDLSEVAPVADSHLHPLPTDLPASGQGVSETNDVEQSLLRELEEMGFKQIDLNKEILRMNEYDLEQSVDDLCGVSEWDPMLEELREMGFSDKETNRRLLKKNNGSIKRVVMDLIAGEKV